MLDTVRTFFSPEFAGQKDLFAGLEVWNNEQLRHVQGTIPVIFISFADIKGRNYQETVQQIKSLFVTIYNIFADQIDTSILQQTERAQFASVCNSMDDLTAQLSIRNLAHYLAKQTKTFPIILLDEYDTPLQEAWIKGFWDELVDFLRVFFNASFKTNEWIGRGLITGITRVSKESIFSDLNNVKVVSTTSNYYTDCFGFTEDEVFNAMDEYGLTDKDEVKKWYDGFIFGKNRAMYNP